MVEFTGAQRFGLLRAGQDQTSDLIAWNFSPRDGMLLLSASHVSCFCSYCSLTKLGAESTINENLEACSWQTVFIGQMELMMVAAGELISVANCHYATQKSLDLVMTKVLFNH